MLSIAKNQDGLPIQDGGVKVWLNSQTTSKARSLAFIENFVKVKTTSVQIAKPVRGIQCDKSFYIHYWL
jgi:hypothetical protein